jgi:uncharacterized protein YlxP (DUF503 family)
MPVKQLVVDVNINDYQSLKEKRASYVQSSGIKHNILKHYTSKFTKGKLD